MKAFALKTYALLVLGMVPAIRHVVAAGIGLGVYINPKVDHKNGRLLLESIVLDEKYAVSISSCSSMLEKVAVTTKQKLKPLSKAFSKLKGSVSRSRYNHSSRSGDGAGPSKSLMHNSYLSTEHSRQVSEDKNELWELPFSSKAVMVGFHSYTAHWEMNGGSLIRWIQSELLYASDSKIMMNGQAYVKKHQGVYAYKWTAKQGYVINFGPPEITLVDLVEIEQDELLGVMFAGNIVRKRVRIDFDIEAIRIPSSYYKTVKSIFLKHGFATVSNGNERAQFRGDRSNFNSLQKNSNSIHITTLQLRNPNFFLLEIDLAAYIIMCGEFCIIPIEECEDETFILGTPLLKALTIVVENSGGKLTYRTPRQSPKKRVRQGR